MNAQSLKCIPVNGFKRAVTRLAELFVILLAILNARVPAYAQNSTVGRPILFVHGICDTAESWAPLETSVINSVTGSQPKLYTNSVPWTVYYDTNSQTVKTWPNGQDFLTTVPSSTRFFSIDLFDPTSANFSSINPQNVAELANVAQVSMLNKGDEIAHVIQAITTLTLAKNVIVIGHSQGGLDARAYIENLAIPYYLSSCSDQNGYACFATPRTYYTQDISELITLDTPHSGAETANWASWLPSTPIACWAEDTLNRRELQDTSFVVSELTGNAPNAPLGLKIASIESYTSPGFLAVGGPDGDEVVTLQEQSIQNVAPTVPSYYDLPDDFGLYLTFYLPPNTVRSPLHLLTVVGNQPKTASTLEAEIGEALSTPALATSITVQISSGLSYSLNGPTTLSGTGPSTFYGMPVGAYTLNYPGGSQQQVLGVDHSTGANNWNLTFNISSSETSPTVITSPATVVGSDGANLNGTVNPNGSAVTAWFEYGTSSTLNTFQSTSPVQSIPSGTTNVPVTYELNYQPANTQLYYRLAVSNGVKTSRGMILSFTTLNTLPPPTLLTPGNSSTGAPLTPQLSWTTVSGATSGYRVMMSTDVSSLPTDPNSDVCGDGCVLGFTGATTSGTTFSPPAGELSSSTTYYWEVHGRSPTQAGTWSSPIWSFKTGSAVSNDFLIQMSPSTQTVNQGGLVTYTVITGTTSGSSQSITLSATNLPIGVAASFNPATVTSGNQSTLTLSASSSASTGTYTMTLVGTGTSATHTATLSVTVAQVANSSGVLSSSPLNYTFNSQTVDTASAPEVFSLVNTGGSALTISSIIESPQFFASFLNGQGLPLTLQPGGSANLQVVFIPNATGPQTGTIKLFNSTNASPLTLNLAGTGVAAPVTTGNIQINATFNGTPWTGGVYYNVTGPESYTGGAAPNTYYNQALGSYTVAYTQAGPFSATFTGITPSATQTLTAGATLTYTLNFTGSNTFAVEDTTPTSAVIGAGTSTQFAITLCILTGATQTVNMAASGLPTSATASFSPNPASVGCSSAGSTATITTSTSTPPGIYSLVFTGTNQDGYSTKNSLPTPLTVDVPPVAPTELVSLSNTGGQGNNYSGATGNLEMYPNAVSANGRYVAFMSSATNLVPNDTNSNPDIFVRDTQLGTTTRVSVASNGAQGDNESLLPSISGDGNYVSFSSIADNLVAGAIPGQQGIYLHNMNNGTTTRVDLAPDGTVGNDNACCSSVSLDGRFIAFQSNASNLVPSVSGTNIFRLDTKTNQMALASVASDGITDGGGNSPQISADGRFVVFISSASDLVPGDTNGKMDVFLHDFETGQTTRVNVASDGTQDNCGASFTAEAPVAISADGRYVTFISCGNTLDPNAVNPNLYNTAYVHDMTTGRTTALATDSQNNIVSIGNIGTLSGDGRFATFGTYLADQTTGRFTLLNVTPSGSAGNDAAFVPSISTDGSTAVFSSQSSNLVPNDTNGYTDVFSFVNPFLGSPRISSLTLGSSQASGGTQISASITLNGPAPAGGASVAVWSNNGVAQPPATVLVPAGATSASFNFNTSLVSVETVMTILASYNGGSGVALLTLEPAPELAASPSSWDFGYQTVGTTSSIESIALTNSGTAPLAINSVQLATGQVFKISANTCGSSIAAGGNCSVSVTFNPSASGSASDAVQISYGSPATTFSIELTGNGAIPVAALSPVPLSFGNQSMPGSSTAVATLTNSGNASLSNISASISGTNAGDFSISSDGCTGVILPANSSCLITVSFSPKAPGSRVATLSIADSASGSPQSTSSSGTGVQSTPTLQWNPSTASLTYGMPLGAGALDATANLNGTNIGGTFAYTATLNGGTPQAVTQTTVLTAGSYTLSATFTPTDTTDYTTATATVSITVNTVTPTVAVTPGSSSITTTEALSVKVTVSGSAGGASPTGSVVLTSGGYTSGATTLTGGSATINIPAGSLATGSDTLTASYTPDSNSSSIYSTASGTSSAVMVNTPAKTTPTVTVAPASNSITTTQGLTVTVTVTGTPTPTGSVTLSGGGYTSAATTLTGGMTTINVPAGSLSVGPDTLTASYTPDSNSLSTYNSATGMNTVTVTQAKSTPTVTVTPSPSSVTTTQPLTVTVTVAGTPAPTGSVTLSGGGYTSAATTLIGGSATINIPAGSLTTGTDALTASYTPDSNSSSVYNSASGSNTVTVTTPTKATPTVTVTPSPSSITTVQALSVTVTVTGTPTPTGSVTLSGGGYTSAATTLTGGMTTINVPAGSLSVGPDTLTASYTPDSNSLSTYNSATGTSSTVSVTLAPQTITFLAISAQTVGTPLALSATSTSGLAVTFTSTTTGICTVSGTTATFIASGTCTIDANQSGNSTYAAAPQVQQSFTVNAAPTFTGSGGGGTISIEPGATTGNTVTISVSPSNGFTGTVNLSCSISPTAASDPPTYSLAPSSVTISGSTTQTSTLTIYTTASSAANQMVHLFWRATGGTTLAVILLFGIPRRRRSWLTMTVLFVFFVSIGAIGCTKSIGSGGSGGGNTGTTPGTYTVTVTGTSGSLTVTLGTITLVVK